MRRNRRTAEGMPITRYLQDIKDVMATRRQMESKMFTCGTKESLSKEDFETK